MFFATESRPERPSIRLYSIFTLALSSTASGYVWPHKIFEYGTSST